MKRKTPWTKDNRKLAIAGRKRRLSIERDQQGKADVTAWPTIGTPRARQRGSSGR